MRRPLLTENEIAGHLAKLPDWTRAEGAISKTSYSPRIGACRASDLVFVRCSQSAIPLINPGDFRHFREIRVNP